MSSNPTGPNTNSPVEPSKSYLEYLDKEMTIMGILSAIAIAAPAAILSFLMADKSGEFAKKLLQDSNLAIILGSLSCVIAALLFYHLRATLAWFYGQVCLAAVLEEDSSVRLAKQKQLCREADSWETWIPYWCGWDALFIAGFLEYVIALITEITMTFWNRHPRWFITIILIPLFIAIAKAALDKHVMTRYKFRDEPWDAFRKSLSGFFFSQKLPHEGVYTRIQQSPIHGVGVFAIRDIKKDEYIFEPDDDDLVSVPVATVDAIKEDALKRLYTDFCVRKDDIFLCPKTFNQLTPSWFLNNSETPNVVPDLSLKFYAIDDIKAGTELTADYRMYSDVPSAVEHPASQ